MSCCFGSRYTGKCQFVDAGGTSSFDGQTYCIWHAPAEIKLAWSDAEVGSFQQRVRATLAPPNGHPGFFNFDGVIFPRGITFEGSRFEDGSFHKARFLGDVVFRSAVFNGCTDFEVARFMRSVDFGAAIFNDIVLFQEVVFEDSAGFLDCQFHDAVTFRLAEFRKSADFSATSASEALSIGNATWRNVKFAGEAKFQNRQFSGSARWVGAQFAKAPVFHGAKFHQAMVFPLQDGFVTSDDEDDARAFRTLKLGMAMLKARTEEGLFFTLEQRCLRAASMATYRRRWRHTWRRVIGFWRSSPKEQIETNSVRVAENAMLLRLPPPMGLGEICISRIYDWCADFGRNALRPMCLLLGAFVVFDFFYAAMDMAHRSVPFDVVGEFDRELVSKSLVFSIEQIVRPFYVWGNSTPDLFEGRVPIGAKYLATFQSVVSLGLLSLSLLAVNWRFKRD